LVSCSEMSVQHRVAFESLPTSDFLYILLLSVHVGVPFQGMLDPRCRYTLVSMNVPEPVMSLAVMPKSRDGSGNFSKALNRFVTPRSEAL